MDLDHKVTVRLKESYIYDITARVEQVHIIRDWVLELVSWDDTKFDMRYRGSADAIDIWFMEEKDAMMCALRWA